jgi:hypothetical protein
VSYRRSISGRVRALERQARDRGSCPLCGGDGAEGLVFQVEGQVPTTEPEPCPGCGKTAYTTFIITEAVGGELHRECPPVQAAHAPATGACPACGRADVTVLEVGPRAWTRPPGE